MREPASFANGVFKPELKPMYPSNSESSQQVTAQPCLYLVPTVLIFFPLPDEDGILQQSAIAAV